MMSAAKFYETQQKYLGKCFLASVQDALNRVLVNSPLYREIENGVRRCFNNEVFFRCRFSDDAGSA